MGYVEDLHEKRMIAWHKGKRLLDKAVAEKRDLTSQEADEYDQIVADIDTLTERADEAAKKEKSQKDSERKMANIMGDTETRKSYDKRWLPGIAEYRDLQREQRAVGTTGAFIPTEFVDRYFDQLRARTAVLAAGPTVINVDHAGSVKVPKVTSSATVGPVAENVAITPSDPGLGNLTLDPIKLAVMTLVAREAIEDSNPDLQMVVSNSLIRDMAVKLDQQFVNGAGTGGEMTGLLKVSGVTAGATTGANGTSLAATSGAGFGVLADTLAAYEGANADPDRAAWIMHSRTWSSIRKIQDDQHRPIVSIDPTSGVRQSLWGHPVYISNSIPVNQTVGTSTDCSSIILADMSQVVVATSRAVELMMSVDFAFDKDQVAIRVTSRYDIGLPQPTAVTVTTGVRP